MTPPQVPRLVLALLALLALVAATATARADGNDAKRRFEEECQRMASIASAAGNFRMMSADTEQCSLGLAEASGQIIGILNLSRDRKDYAPRFRSQHYSIEIGDMSADKATTEKLIHAARMLADSDGGAGEQPIRMYREDVTDPLVAAGLAWLAALLLGVTRRARVSFEVRLPHLIPVLIQVAIFAYWSVYWPGVRSHMPMILAQVALAFGADAAFSMARFGGWRAGASPLPIVLSANLFVWFDPHGAVLSILIAFASKTLLRRPGAAHIFNPSALGLTITGILSYAFPDFFAVGGLFHTMSLAPNLAEVMLLLALIPQTRFRVLPVSLAAVVALRLTDNPTVLRPPMILVATLLLTDPATLPRTDLGKIFAGLIYGFTMPVTSWLLRRWGFPDDFAKVIPLPVVNVLVPQLDRLAATTTSLAARALSAGRGFIDGRVKSAAATRLADTVSSLAGRQVHNYALVAVWLLISLPPLAQEKASSFEPALHWTWGTPLVVRDADDVPRCERNPIFCRPFGLMQEAALWRERLRNPPPAPMPPPATANGPGSTGESPTARSTTP